MNPEVMTGLECDLSQTKTSSSSNPEPQPDSEQQQEGEALTLLAHLSNLYPFPKGKRNRFRKPTKKKEFLLFQTMNETNVKHKASSDRSGNNKSHKKQKGDEKARTLEAKSPAMVRAEEVRLTLELPFPSFAKHLVRSNVSRRCWMGLPRQFCKTHLPHAETTFTLEDESGELSKIKYIGHNTGLSAGWRQFCVAHNLLEGDALTFQLTGPKRFKVYIIRANDLSELDGALGLLNSDAQITQNDAETGSALHKSTEKKRKSLPLAIVQKKYKKSHMRKSAPFTKQAAEQSKNDSEVLGSEVVEGYELSAPTLQFNDVKSLEEFGILVNGLVIDPELQEDTRNKYYDLCCSQNAFLHENLIPGINYKLIIGTISETVNIANALSSCKLTTSRVQFAEWERSLKAFKLLGMNVGFLLARLSQLVKLAFDSEAAEYTRRYTKAEIEKSRIEEEIERLEAKIEELKGLSGRCGAEIESLKPKADDYEVKLQEEIAAPW